MSDIVIKAENIGKLYKLGEIGTGSLSHDLNRWWASVRGKEDPFAKIGQTNDRTQKGDTDFVWALKDINFEVRQGEVLGIIGRNGAGKSTLLKILSKVTTPTTGQIKVKGRIASLLEVGTGFHPELTGRENIFLNGAILGMTKREIRQKFDEIVDFAGVERYIDTPVKRYSSGMYVRLAFAVAAFLEPEILIVDEVLAVGDTEFQSKCLGRMQDASKNDGRTVLFVSHNLEAVKSLCSSGLLFKNGQILFSGNVQKCIDKYIVGNDRDSSSIYFGYVNEQKTIFISSAHLEINSQSNNIYFNGDKVIIKIIVEANSDIDFSFEVLIKDQNRIPILFSPFGLLTAHKEYIEKGKKNEYEISLTFPFLAVGRYYLDLMLVDSGIKFYDYAENAMCFDVESSHLLKTGWSFTQKRGQGSILLDKIEVNKINEN